MAHKFIYSMWAALHKAQQRLKRSLHGGFIHRIFGGKLYLPFLWALDKQSVAGGLSLGLFIAFTPTIPFQMVLAVTGAILFRVNLPAALIGCWITNPITALPIYMVARHIGQRVLEGSYVLEILSGFFVFNGKQGTFLRQTTYLWTGSLIISAGSALAGNVLVRLLWRLGGHLKEDRKERR